MGMDIDMDMNMGMDTDMAIAMDLDMDTDTETEMDTGKEMEMDNDMDTGHELVFFCTIVLVYLLNFVQFFPEFRWFSHLLFSRIPQNAAESKN